MNGKLSSTLVLYRQANGVAVTVGEAKRRLVAAIYDVARERHVFIAADVWAKIADEEFRCACVDTRLIAAAFAIARREQNGFCRPDGFTFCEGDDVCNGRPQRRWLSRLTLACRSSGNDLRRAA